MSTNLADAAKLHDPDVVAEMLTRRRKWVVDNATALGGIKVGRVWRFDLDEVRARLNAHKKLDPFTPTPQSAARQRARGRTGRAS